jgi:retinol dehydrogenase-12
MSEFGHDTPSTEVMAKFADQAKGKMIVVTGANSGMLISLIQGIGYETSRALASCGAQVVLCSRKVENGEAACAKIKETVPEANISTMTLDLNSLASIDAFAKAYMEKFDRLDILINNAGIMACPKALTVDGIESQFGVCHVGHFHLTSLLLPMLIKSGSVEAPTYHLFIN